MLFRLALGVAGFMWSVAVIECVRYRWRVGIWQPDVNEYALPIAIWTVALIYLFIGRYA